MTSVAIENNFFAHRRPKSKPLLKMSVNPLHLFAADPYHPPGYAGYVPQKMYRHAGTYGRTTHDILKGRVHQTTNNHCPLYGGPDGLVDPAQRRTCTVQNNPNRQIDKLF